MNHSKVETTNKGEMEGKRKLNDIPRKKRKTKYRKTRNTEQRERIALFLTLSSPRKHAASRESISL